MSEKEAEAAKPKRLMETSEPQEAEEEEKRSTRKKPRIDYNEEKKAQKDDSKTTTTTSTTSTATSASKTSTESEPSKASKANDDDDIQEVTPLTADTKTETGNSPSKSTEDKSDDLLGLPVEQTGLEGAAFQSRMPFDKMTQVEAACFPDLVVPLHSQKLYLHIRNRLLQMWLENPKQQLVSKDALKRLEAPWDSDEALVRNLKVPKSYYLIIF